jgi:hypothetical protein
MSAIGQPTPAPGTPPPAPTAPAPTSTGEAARQGADGFWGNFPNVPEDARTALEPHLKDVQAHVTRLEQKAAPFKDYTPEQVQGLKSFADQFDANPMQMFLAIANDLQQRGVLHQELDLEALAAVARGEDPDAGTEPVEPEGNPAMPENLPPWAQALVQEVQELRQGRETEQRTQQERREDAALAHQLNSIKTSLKESGFDENLLTDERVLGLLIAHNGNPQAVIKSEMDHRTALLKGVVKPTDEPKPVRQERVPSGSKPKQRGGDSFGKASSAAEQYLAKAAQEAQN